MSAPTVSFNGSDLASSVPGLRIIKTNPYRAPGRVLTNEQIANSSKSTTSSVFFKDKKVNVRVEIGQNTRELFDAAIDQLYALVQAREATLLLNYGSSTRKWTATLANISVDDNAGGWGRVELEFQCSDPMGYDNTSTNLFSSSRTGAASTENFVLGGSAEWQLPIITLTLTACEPNDSAKDVIIGNTNNGQQVTVNRAWTDGDVLEIDSQNKTVKVNGAEVAFSGAIPEWEVGAGQLSYSDGFTSRTFTIAAIYYKRYM